MKTAIIAATLAVVLAACGRESGDTGAARETTASELSTAYREAVANTSRTERDRSRDAGRKPAQVLEFFGIEPGMNVLDMFAGGGYYTEILSRVVGSRVFATET